MIFNRHIVFFTLVAVLLGLSGCPGNEVNTTQSGLVVHLAEVHVDSRPGEIPAGVRSLKNSDSMQGGYNQTVLEHHDILDNSGHVLSLYRTYLVLDEMDLVPCTTLTQLPRRVLESVIPAAQAHAGHGGEPVGGRALDRPNVIDIVSQDEYILPLGNLAKAPGRYCGVRVSLARLAGDGYGIPPFATASNDDPTTYPDVPEMAGLAFSMRGDYCTSIENSLCLQRSKVAINDSGLILPMAQTINFDQPLEISSGFREVYVAVGIAYGEWLQNVNVTLLNGNADERQKLLDNIAGSIHVYAKGFGDLPVSVQ